MNIRRATIADNDIIRAVYSDESVWPYITDDGTPDINTVDFIEPLKNQAIYFLIVEDNNTPAAVFLFHPWNTVTYEMHSAVMPKYRGEGSIEAARLAGMWMFSNVVMCMKLVTHIAVNNLPAIVLARKGGMHKEGINRKSFLKNGKLIDQYIYGICKEEV